MRKRIRFPFAAALTSSALLVGASVLLLFLFYHRVAVILEDSFKREILSTVHTAAMLIRGETVETVETADSLPYLELKETLWSIRASNPEITRVFTLVPPRSGDVFRMQVDAGDPVGPDRDGRIDPQGESLSPGAAYHLAPGLVDALRERAVVEELTTSPLRASGKNRSPGDFLAYAPIRDRADRVVAVLGLEVSGAAYWEDRRLLRTITLALFAVALGLALGGGFLVPRLIALPLERAVSEQTRTIGVHKQEIETLRQDLKASHGRVSSLEEFGRSIIENMASGILAVDLQGQVTAGNPAISEMLGFDEQDLKGMKADKIILDHLLDRTLRRGQGFCRKETEALRKDGRRIPIGVTTSLLRDGEGETQGAVAIIADLSQVKEMEETLRKADQLASLGEMSASIAHEIRNPLAGISAGVEYLKSTFEAQDPRSKSVELILDELYRLDKVVKHLLVFARRPQLELSSVNCQEVLDRALSFVESQMNSHGIALRQEYSRSLSEVPADELQIGQVFLNLLLNAVQAMPQGGTLTLGLRSRGDVLEIRVQDTGVGIPPEQVKRVFDPFFSTKRDGAGLGLSICQRIVAEHKGRITVHSTLGRGTEFVVILPLQGSSDGKEKDSGS